MKDVFHARVAELVDAADSKSAGFATVGVRVPPLVPYLNPATSGIVQKAPELRGFLIFIAFRWSISG